MPDGTSPIPPRPDRAPAAMNRTQAVYFLIYGGRLLSDFAPNPELEAEVVGRILEALRTVGATLDELDMAITAGKAGAPSGWESLINFEPKADRK